MATKRIGPRGRVAGGVAAAGAGAIIVGLALAGGAGGGQGAATGQTETGLAASQSTPATAPAQAVHVHLGRPTHVYAGGCDDLGEATHALNPIGAGTMTGPAMADAPAMAIGDPVGSAEAVPVEIGRTTLAVPLAELVADRHAVNVYRSEQEYGATVACGEVGGAIGDGSLAFGLRERNGSGLSGLVVFTERGTETEVVAYLAAATGDLAAAVMAAAAGDGAEAGKAGRPDRADRPGRADRAGRGSATPAAE